MAFDVLQNFVIPASDAQFKNGEVRKGDQTDDIENV